MAGKGWLSQIFPMCCNSLERAVSKAFSKSAD
jgi:hypothetical protein